MQYVQFSILWKIKQVSLAINSIRTNSRSIAMSFDSREFTFTPQYQFSSAAAPFLELFDNYPWLYMAWDPLDYLLFVLCLTRNVPCLLKKKKKRRLPHRYLHFRERMWPSLRERKLFPSNCFQKRFLLLKRRIKPLISHLSPNRPTPPAQKVPTGDRATEAARMAELQANCCKGSRAFFLSITDFMFFCSLT